MAPRVGQSLSTIAAVAVLCSRPAGAVTPMHATMPTGQAITPTAGQDFRKEDQLDTPRFDAALWSGLKPNGPGR